MIKYRNNHHKFEIELPNERHGPRLISRLFGMDANPEFYEQNRSSLKFAIGPISPEPSVREQQLNLENIARKYGHDVIEVGSIAVYEKEHATIVCKVPLIQQPPVMIGRPEYIVRPVPSMLLKNYSLIFDGIEYFATASIDKFPEENFDEIIKTFRLF
ncbi:hypothetical protein J4455_03940 [Candidatus Woesearchaeota archaeon]|nr:hypothetical protein [Candidatus Woesearchaeota archaeon]